MPLRNFKIQTLGMIFAAFCVPFDNFFYLNRFKQILACNIQKCATKSGWLSTLPIDSFHHYLFIKILSQHRTALKFLILFLYFLHETSHTNSALRG